MPAFVSFVITNSSGPIGNITRVVATEEVAVPGTTTREVQEGESVIVFNSESSDVRVAWGSTPDADAADETDDTSAGLPLGAGSESPVLIPEPGSNINIKALA